MKNFFYINAPALQDALDILSQKQENACVVAGGTNVLVDIRAGKRNNLTLVNISSIESLKGIKIEGDTIRIGSLTTIHELAHSELLQEKAPALFLAANDFADPTLNHTATIGGNIANASPAADTATPLLALLAQVVIEKKGATRRVPVSDFFLGVNKTALKSDELITALEFKAQPQSCFYKLGLRNAMAISIVTVACGVECDSDGLIQTCAIALGSVAPTPVRAYHVEKQLIGKEYSDENVDAALKELGKDISPIDDIRASGAYRRDVSVGIVKRTLAKSMGICAQEGVRKDG